MTTRYLALTFALGAALAAGCGDDPEASSPKDPGTVFADVPGSTGDTAAPADQASPADSPQPDAPSGTRSRSSCPLG